MIVLKQIDALSTGCTMAEGRSEVEKATIIGCEPNTCENFSINDIDFSCPLTWNTAHSGTLIFDTADILCEKCPNDPSPGPVSYHVDQSNEITFREKW